MTICILGRQPGLSLAELESLFGADAVRPLGTYAALVSADITPAQAARLGGSIKVAKVLKTEKTTDFKGLIDAVRSSLLKHVKALGDGKIRLGLSTYGLHVQSSQVNGAGLDLKRTVKNLGRSVRTVPNSETALSSAQVMHNKLTGPTGLEILLVRDGHQTHVAQTTYVQDINAYTLRDRGRPKRDAFVGMLPPKLAQIMINLSAAGSPIFFKEPPQASRATTEHGEAEARSAKNDGEPFETVPSEEHRRKGSGPNTPRLLDPFCGTGVVLQEATLMGYQVYGSDISPKMVDYSTANLDWMRETLGVTVESTVELGDATNHQWSGTIDAVVCEGYLGKPQRSIPSRDQLEILVSECDNIARGFLKNIHGQLQAGTPLVVGLPAWKIGSQFRHLPLINELSELGFERTPFVHALPDDFLYFREDQYVAREIIVIKKK